MATRMQQRRGTQAQWTAANPILAAGEIGFETDTSKFKMGNGSSTWSALQYFANASELAAIVGGLSGIDLPASLDTLNELAAALGDDPQFFTTVTNSLALKAPLASPTLTGTPSAPTADITTNTTQIATTAFVQSKVNALIDAAPGALNTLNELAAAINNDQTFATTVATSIGTKVAKAGDTMTGALSLSGAPTLDSHASTKGYVDAEVAGALVSAAGYANTAVTTSGTNADTKIGQHNTLTENVHGIANTQNLATLDDLSASVGGVTAGYATLGGVGIDWNANTEKFDIDNTVATVSDITDHNADTLNVHGITNTALLETTAGAQTKADTAAAAAVSTHNSDATDVHGIADTAALATKTYADGAVSTHNSDTTGVHGIVDTAALETTTGAQAKADAAAASAVSTHSDDTTSVHGIADTAALATKAYADNAVSTHQADTTNVHGIADTSLLATTADVAAVTKTSLGLGNVDNTADASKPVSTAQATAIATAKSEAIADATSQVNALLTGAPAALNTLDELAAALGDDANFAASVTTSLGLKVDSLTPISQKTASYTLSSLTERDDLIEMGSGSALTLTIPTDATLDFPIGTSIDILQTGAGQVTIAPVSGTVTVNATPGLKLRTTWSSCTLFKRAANTWVVYGDLTA